MADPDTVLKPSTDPRDVRLAELETRLRQRDALIAQGWRLKTDLHYLEARGGRHTESAWAKRVAPALKFLFPGKS